MTRPTKCDCASLRRQLAERTAERDEARTQARWPRSLITQAQLDERLRIAEALGRLNKVHPGFATEFMFIVDKLLDERDAARMSAKWDASGGASVPTEGQM